MGHQDLAVDHVVRISLYSLAVELLWRPTFKEPLSAMTRTRSEHLYRAHSEGWGRLAT